MVARQKIVRRPAILSTLSRTLESSSSSTVASTDWNPFLFGRSVSPWPSRSRRAFGSRKRWPHSAVFVDGQPHLRVVDECERQGLLCHCTGPLLVDVGGRHFGLECWLVQVGGGRLRSTPSFAVCVVHCCGLCLGLAFLWFRNHGRMAFLPLRSPRQASQQAAKISRNFEKTPVCSAVG